MRVPFWKAVRRRLRVHDVLARLERIEAQLASLASHHSGSQSSVSSAPAVSPEASATVDRSIAPGNDRQARAISIAGTRVLIEGDPRDPYFQHVERHADDIHALWSLVSRQVPANSLIVDVGANIGLSTIALSQAVPRGKVIAFEPSPRNLEFLKKNIRANGINNVEIQDFALSDEAGHLAFHTADYGAGSHVVSGEHLGMDWRNTTVLKTTLDTIFVNQDASRVALIKIDAEGHEPNILAGARRLLARDRPLLFIEFNAWCLNAFGGHSPAAFARALWSSFEVLSVNEGGDLVAAAGDPLSFLHVHLTQHGCVDDLVLRPRDGVEIPSLAAMTWPSAAVAAAGPSPG